MPTATPKHEHPKRRAQSDVRDTAHRRGYSVRWRAARARYLALHPLCVKCAAERYVKPATVVDHIKPHKGDPALFWDVSNWQSLCKTHHDQKTAREDGGFGRAGGGAITTDSRF